MKLSECGAIGIVQLRAGHFPSHVLGFCRATPCGCVKKQGVSTQHLVYQEDYLHDGKRMNDVPKSEAHVMLTTTCSNTQDQHQHEQHAEYGTHL